MAIGFPEELREYSETTIAEQEHARYRHGWTWFHGIYPKEHKKNRPLKQRLIQAGRVAANNLTGINESPGYFCHPTRQFSIDEIANTSASKP